MSTLEITHCPGTLSTGFNTYSRTCLNKLFNGKKVSHILPYDPPQISEEDAAKFIENRKRLSISGVQEKLSLLLDKNKLRLTQLGEQGSYILKPIPRDIKKADQVPANEHLTMQIAKQVYGIPTAENALIFFKNGDPAYITKRFDMQIDGKKLGEEDFASLAAKTAENAGEGFKYAYSYQEIAELIVKCIPAHVVEMEKFYRLVIFNYLFSNGDAHLKNFSVLQTENGDYILSPAYDLINTSLHVNDSDFALKEGLFKGYFFSDEMEKNGRVGLEDFQEFAKRLNISENRRAKLLAPFLKPQEAVISFIERSYLNEATKQEYLSSYHIKRQQLNTK